MQTDTDRVLVLIQLNGGNDGLNTVIPLDQYANLQAAGEEMFWQPKMPFYPFRARPIQVFIRQWKA